MSIDSIKPYGLTLSIALLDPIFSDSPAREGTEYDNEDSSALQAMHTIRLFDCFLLSKNQNQADTVQKVKATPSKRKLQHQVTTTTATTTTTNTTTPSTASMPYDAANLRDAIFDLALPTDWHVEVKEPAGLQCSLYAYQRRALAWMLWREGLDQHGRSSFLTYDASSRKSQLPCNSETYTQVVLPSGYTVFYDQVIGFLRRYPAPPLSPVPSGLLCEEMGLGKTVEVIALILANKKEAQTEQNSPNSNAENSALLQASKSSKLQQQQASMESTSKVQYHGGTLVVCPPALLQQWKAEISNHAGTSLNVVLYDGLAIALQELRDLAQKEQRLSTAHGDQRQQQASIPLVPARQRGKLSRFDRVSQEMIREAEVSCMRSIF